SNQTGIRVSEPLSEAWRQATAKGSTTRAIKITIHEESTLEEDGIAHINDTLKNDWDFVKNNLVDKQPSYFVVRHEEGGSKDWLLLCFIPDNASVRQKMIYAATRASLTKDLGDSNFLESISGTQKEIRANEKAMAEMKGAAHRRSHAPGMNFPLTDRAIGALRKLANNVPVFTKPSVAALKDKVSSPASTPLPEFPVISRQNDVTGSVEPSKSSMEANVADNEWEDENKDKKEDKAAPTETVAEGPTETVTEVPADEVSTVTQVRTEAPTEITEAHKENAAETFTEAAKKVPTEATKEEETEAPKKEAEATEEKTTEAPKEEEEVVEEVKVTAPAERTINFVTLAIDQENERIDLASETKITIEELITKIDKGSPRFNFFAYEHSHNGTTHDSLVFIYTCPGKSKIRERMLYASSKGGVLEAAKSEAGLDVDKKLETTDVDELTKKYVEDELHPVTEPSSNSNTGGMKGFKKPTRPGVGARKVMW
ncbi:Twinfilin-1, partial [Modicella reniformis]